MTTKDRGRFLTVAARTIIITGLIVSACTHALAQPSARTVVLFIIDGLQPDAARVAMENGAINLKFLNENGVQVQEAYCTSPAGRAIRPDGVSPWGSASPPNVAMHAGTHVFESKDMDDVFLAARRSGIKSVFSGSADVYREFSTADFMYAESHKDSIVIDFAIKHFKNDDARLISIHLQELRNHWKGPEEKLKPGSAYQQAILAADRLLGKLIGSLKSGGVWDSTYVIVSADHGMGMTGRSDHPPSVLSSWQTYLNFHGPGIKKGASIPYAETPDIAIMIAYFLGISELRGHIDPKVTIPVRGPTGTLLLNIFEGRPDNVDHPRYIRRYLESKNWKPADGYAEYRTAMLEYIGND